MDDVAWLCVVKDENAIMNIHTYPLTHIMQLIYQCTCSIPSEWAQLDVTFICTQCGHFYRFFSFPCSFCIATWLQLHLEPVNRCAECAVAICNKRIFLRDKDPGSHNWGRLKFENTLTFSLSSGLKSINYTFTLTYFIRGVDGWTNNESVSTLIVVNFESFSKVEYASLNHP